MSLWDDGEAEEPLEELVARIRKTQPGLHHQTWIRGNDLYPLRATTSLNVTGAPWNDDVVLSADIRADQSSLSFACDISDGDGRILADGPQTTTSSSTSPDKQTSWAGQCLNLYVGFLEENFPIIVDELDRRARGRTPTGP